LSIVKALKGTIEHVVITDVEDNTFFAKIEIESPGGSVGVDSRVSDAIVLATLMKVPIYTEEAVFDWAAKHPKPDLSKPAALLIVWPIKRPPPEATSDLSN